MAMNDQYSQFWNKAGPGLLDFGLGLYSRNAAQKEAAQRLAQARGPVYDQATAGASGMLSAAGNFDPQSFAADRFKAQQALVAPVQQKQQEDLIRSLRAKGQLGISTYNPGVEGITPNGTPMNPQLAAFFAAQNAQRSKDAYGSLGEGQQYLNGILDRAGMLQRTAANAQSTGLEGVRTQPSRATSNAELIRGGLGVLKDSGILKDVVGRVPGMISGGIDWMKNLFGGGDDIFGGADFSLGF